MPPPPASSTWRTGASSSPSSRSSGAAADRASGCPAYTDCRVLRMNAPSSKPAIAELTVAANGLDVHALACGPDDGPLVLLLHGFPECALGWRHQLTALGAAGLRAV